MESLSSLSQDPGKDLASKEKPEKAGAWQNPFLKGEGTEMTETWVPRSNSRQGSHVQHQLRACDPQEKGYCDWLSPHILGKFLSLDINSPLVR